MAIPTRIIEKDTFEDLLRQEEGDMVIRFQVEAYDFIPPRPDETYEGNADRMHIHVLFLNTAEPVIYKDRQANDVLVIMPKYADQTYTDWSECHPNGDAWVYVLAPHGWDAEDWQDELDIAKFYFKDEDEKLPKYELEDVSTH